MFRSCFLPRRANDQLPINVPAFGAIRRGPLMNALEPLPLLLILDVVSDGGVANQMVLVPRLTVDGQRGLVFVRNDLERILLESLGEVVDPTAKAERRWACQHQTLFGFASVNAI